MLKRSPTIKRKTFLERSSTIVTVNENLEKIDLNEYKIMYKICKTNLGFIYICKSKKMNKLYFMKILKKSNLLTSKNTEHVTNEYLIISSIYHPFILELKGINNTDPVTLNFLFEYIPGGSLNTLLKAQKRLPLNNARFYLASVITALDYLHKKSIVYRDLRPQNILINKNGYIKLADFGLAKKMESDVTFTMCGAPEYYSPEMIRKTGYNKSTDFWCLGILLYEMLIGCTPFFDADPLKIYQKINIGKILFPKKIDKNAKIIIKHFLNLEQHERLGCRKNGVGDIIEEPFFKDFDWKGLLYKNLQAPYIPEFNGNLDTSNYKRIEDKNDDNEENIEVDKEKDPFYNW